jgi:large subunit ribosomal protein L9
MKVILQEDVPDLGEAGDLVEVKSGYGRNFLIPKGLAVLATPRNIKTIEHQRRLFTDRQTKLHSQASELAEQINILSATFTRKSGEDDKLYGSVTSQNIAEFFTSQNLPVDRKQIMLEEPIKSLGAYNVPIKLHPGVVAEIKVWVVKE